MMKNSKAQRVAQTGLLFALAITLSWLESGIAPLLGLMPAMKLGLANMVVMYALLFLPLRAAWALVFLKALFALLTRGATAGFLSLCGGALSLLVLLGLLCVPFQVSGYMFCVSGALAHNLGQLLGAAGILSSAMALAYAPLLLAAGVLVGALNCLLTRALFTALPQTARRSRWKRNPFKNKNIS
ncbi:Gx transporter family protein [uncultured Subdoligranulum sp.]|uniref:Gx transporter family protein n=1 Tax=uncultured Subdoligranulum sp. TaxID=512298 RepID=UPI0026254C9A|nr:Gx transporter family protein [uncultured Subdoligranulum sp.]